MNKKQNVFLTSLLITIGGGATILLMAFLLYFALNKKSSPTIIKETVIVEVTPTSSSTPSPTEAVFPTSKDRIVFLSVWDKDFYIINANGTNLARITTDSKYKSCPTWLPDGQRISFLERGSRDEYYDFYVMGVDGKDKQLLITAKFDTEYGQLPKWSPDGSKLIFSAFEDNSNNSQIYIYDGVNLHKITEGNTRERFPVWSPDGQEFAFISYPEDKPILVVKKPFNTEGYEAWLVSDDNISNFFTPSWSPNGSKLAFVSGRNLVIGTFNESDFDLDKRTDLISNDEVINPSWSPDGEKIAFYYGDSQSAYNVMFMASETSHIEGENSRLLVYPESQISWSADGKSIVVVGDYQTENWNLYTVSTNGHSTQLTNSGRRDHCPAWSPK